MMLVMVVVVLVMMVVVLLMMAMKIMLALFSPGMRTSSSAQALEARSCSQGLVRPFIQLLRRVLYRWPAL
eukprot:8311986-Lingulodinium_polyedra.AAC.1